MYPSPITERSLVGAIERLASSAEPPPIDLPEADPSTDPAPGPVPQADVSRVRVMAKEGLEDLIPGYLAKCAKSLVDLADAVSRKDLDAARRIAHGMKGCGLGYGFAEITEIGREIESAAAGNDVGAASEQISRLGDYLSRLDVIYP